MPQTQLRAYQIETTTFEQKVETAVQTGAASDDVVKKVGDTMSGDLTVPNLKAQQVNLTSVNPSDTATFFGTDDSGDSTLHMRIGNGSGDKIQIESWNGSAATSLMEVGQTTVTIKGDLVVSGTTTTVNSETLEVADNYIILNSGVSGAPTLDAGIRVERGSETDAIFKWNETEDKWEADSGLIVGGNIRTAVGSGLSDVDGDTYITVEKIANENIIRFYSGGNEISNIDSDGFNVNGYIKQNELKIIIVNAFSVGMGASTITDGMHSIFVNGQAVYTADRAVALVVISGTDGSIIHSDTYDTHTDGSSGGPEGDRLASDINTYNTNGNILVINTYDQPGYMSNNMKDALNNVMKSTRIVDEGAAYRGAFAIAYQHGHGKLAEDVSNTPGGANKYGDSDRAFASIHFVTYVGL